MLSPLPAKSSSGDCEAAPDFLSSIMPYLDMKNAWGKASIKLRRGRPGQRTLHQKFPTRLSGVSAAMLVAALFSFAVPCAVPCGIGCRIRLDWCQIIGEARLVSAVKRQELQTLPLGLEFTLASGWKIYWRTPGEAGLSPVLDLSDSATPGLSGSFRWPLPTRFDAFGFDNFGYENAVILPFDVTGHVPGTPVQITADLEALACADICVPLAGRLELDLPDGTAKPSRHAQALAQFAAMVPRRADKTGISPSAPSLRVVAAAPRDGGLYVELADGAPDLAELFVEGISDVAFKAPVAEGRAVHGSGAGRQARPCREDPDADGQRPAGIRRI